jgi:DNA-binding CsgD family transcriptional regulator
MNKEAIEYYQSVSSVIEDFCRPLNNYFNIAYFSYFKAYHDATYVLLSNDIQVTQKYCLTVKTDLIYQQRYLESKNVNELILWPEDPINFGMQTAFDMGYWNGMTLTNIDDEGVECYDFASYKNSCKINSFYIEYYSVLEEFVEYFKTTFEDIIAQSTLCKAKYKDRYNLHSFKRKKQAIQDIPAFIEETGIDGEFFNINKKLIYLTHGETQCLKLLHKGCSPKEAEKELLLSSKSLKIHINNIKNKIGNNDKHEFNYTTLLIEK